jgi:hypothetical protein
MSSPYRYQPDVAEHCCEVISDYLAETAPQQNHSDTHIVLRSSAILLHIGILFQTDTPHGEDELSPALSAIPIHRCRIAVSLKRLEAGDCSETVNICYNLQAQATACRG